MPEPTLAAAHRRIDDDLQSSISIYYRPTVYLYLLPIYSFYHQHLSIMAAHLILPSRGRAFTAMPDPTKTATEQGGTESVKRIRLSLPGTQLSVDSSCHAKLGYQLVRASIVQRDSTPSWRTCLASYGTNLSRSNPFIRCTRSVCAFSATPNAPERKRKSPVNYASMLETSFVSMQGKASGK